MAKQKQNVVDESAFDQALISWSTPKFLRFHRGVLWFLLMGLLDAMLLAYGYLTDSYTMIAVFVVLPLVIILETNKKPEIVDVIISEYGIKFGEMRIPYSNIKKFWILHLPPAVDELHVLTGNRVHPELTIQLMGADPTILRQYLVTQVPEWEGKGPTLFDTFIRILRLN
ncbi:MAG: hypothetical protein WC897_01360 [Candidatus Gracilibacteria bacterium]